MTVFNRNILLKGAHWPIFRIHQEKVSIVNPSTRAMTVGSRHEDPHIHTCVGQQTERYAQSAPSPPDTGKDSQIFWDSSDSSQRSFHNVQKTNATAMFHYMFWQVVGQTAGAH